MVAIPSVNPFRLIESVQDAGVVGVGSEAAISCYLEDRLRERGFDVTRQEINPEIRLPSGEVVPPRWNILAVRYPNGDWNGKSILLFGHTDTVDVKEGWESDPFIITPVIEQGRERWYALGANDMKAGLAAILEAVDGSTPSQFALKVAFVADEEFYSLGANTLVQSDFLKDVEVAIAPEIGDTDSSLLGDAQSFAIGRVGRVEFDIQVSGRACHGVDALISRDAVNAVHESARLQCAVGAYSKQISRSVDYDGVRGRNSAFISYHMGGMPSLSVPDRASFVFDRTFLPDESIAEEEQRLQAIVIDLKERGEIDPRVGVTIALRKRPTPPCEPFLVDKTCPAVARIIAALQASATPVQFYFGRSVGDENRIAAAGIPTLTIGPNGAGSHTAREWIDPASIDRLVDSYRRIIACF